jgi:Tfp pilus assembly protein PilF
MATVPFPTLEAASLCREAIRRIAAGDHEEAERIALRALARWPDHPRVLVVAGNCALVSGFEAVAIERFERSLVLAPGFREALNNLGFIYRRQHRLDEARLLFQGLVSSDPSDEEGWINYSATFVNEGRSAEGEAVAREALRHRPDCAALRWNLALVLLEQGRWREGWEQYCHRFDVPALRGAVGRLPTNLPRLPSPESLHYGQVVQCRGEQGLGDEILFGGLLRRFVDDAKSRGAAVSIGGNRRLERVYRRAFPDALWRERGQERTADWILPMGDLPAFYRTDDSQFPRHAGYYRADPHASTSLRRHLLGRARGKPVVGLAPSGGVRWTHDVYRKVMPAEWEPLLSAPALFVGLGYRDEDDRLAEVAKTARAEYLTFPELTRHADYGRTFDLVAALDLVITVPTSVLHVAGAVGTPCWVAMDHRAAWRECSRDHAIPWYPVTHRRFVRGAEEADWSHVIRRIKSRLACFNSGGGPRLSSG